MDRASFTWKDGTWFEGNEPMLGPMSHAWWMASSVFDGARSIARLVPDLDRHCARIIESGKAFGMTAPLTADEIIALAWEGIEKFPEDAIEKQRQCSAANKEHEKHCGNPWKENAISDARSLSGVGALSFREHPPTWAIQNTA